MLSPFLFTLQYYNIDLSFSLIRTSYELIRCLPTYCDTQLHQTHCETININKMLKYYLIIFTNKRMLE